jgi:murein DD-endopeptidase MepM/ murein hydrolase activator NlpD
MFVVILDMIFMKHKKAALLAFVFLFHCHGKAQLFNKKIYAKDYYQWPVGAKVGIVANFGELRPNHYHMGLDCRTDGRENLPVYAAADGYIAKVNIDATGFGRAIYINHPNGHTTLYAHLNNFFPELQAFVKAQQYSLKQWAIKLDIPENLFKVKQGQFIAYSGNTGGSQGPHVHFEVRDTKTDKVLNPLRMGFPITDGIAPHVLRLALYDRRKSIYEQTPVIYPLKNINGKYMPASGKINVQSDQVMFAITAYDSYTGSTNQNGIYGATLFENEKAVSGFEMDSISYDETRYLNAHIDYKTKAGGGPFLQLLSPLPGYVNGIYRTAPGEDGVIRISEGESKSIKILVWDANENQSTVSFELTCDAIQPVAPVVGNLFIPDQVNVFEDETLFLYLPAGSTYDSFHFNYTKGVVASGLGSFSLLRQIPVHAYFPIGIKAEFPVEDTGHVVMKESAAGRDRFKKTTEVYGWYRASFRDAGSFQLIVDKLPPSVTPVGTFKDGCLASGLKRIAFAVTDNTKEIAVFTGLIDGEWVLFSNDKGKVFVHEFEENLAPGEHQLKLIVKDLVGNTTEKTYRFTR